MTATLALQTAFPGLCPVTKAVEKLAIEGGIEERGAIYAQSYDILCNRPVPEGLYPSATFLASPREAAKDGAYRHLNELTSLKIFVTAFAGHIAAVAAR